MFLSSSRNLFLGVWWLSVVAAVSGDPRVSSRLTRKDASSSRRMQAQQDGEQQQQQPQQRQQFEITTTDPLQIRSETSAIVFDLLESTPPDQPAILRYDQLADALVEHATNTIAVPQDRIQFVMNGLLVTNIWDTVIREANGQVNLSLFAAALLGLLPGDFGVDPYPGLLESRAAALDIQQERNFTEEMIDMHNISKSLFSSMYPGSSAALSAPLYALSYGYENATNAKSFSAMQDRCLIFLNLGARRMLEPDWFTSAVIHETWHCLVQIDISFQDLWGLLLQEGVIMYLVSLVKPALHETELLFWSDEELAAAEERKGDILRLFEQDKENLNDSEQRARWYELVLDRPALKEIPGAPSRCGYYIAWLAVQAYMEQQTKAEGGDNSIYAVKQLLEKANTEQGREEIWQSLMAQEETDDSTTTTGSGTATQEKPEDSTTTTGSGSDSSRVSVAVSLWPSETSVLLISTIFLREMLLTIFL